MRYPECYNEPSRGEKQYIGRASSNATVMTMIVLSYNHSSGNIL